MLERGGSGGDSAALFAKEIFEQIIKDSVEKSLIPCQKVVNDSKLSIKDIDEIILVNNFINDFYKICS